jgi:hypothetical protein
VPIAAPSANPFGYISPTTAEHVREQLGEEVDIFLDGGTCRVGVESTIVSFLGEQPKILRPGGIPAEEIKRINPNAKVEVFPEGVTMENVERVLEGADIVIDGIDVEVMKERREMYNVARRNGQPVFCCPSLGWGVTLGIFDPIASPTFDECFGEIPDDPYSKERMEFNIKFVLQFLSTKPSGIDMVLARRRARERKPPSTAVAARLNAAVVSCAIYAYLLDKGGIPVMPVSLQIDLLGTKIGKTGPKKRWLLNKAANRMLGKGEDE